MTYHVFFSEEDYLRFNEYFTFCTPNGKKALRNYRLTFLCVAIILYALISIVLRDLLTRALIAALLIAISVVWGCTAKRAIRKNLCKTLEKMKETGKLPYVPEGDVSFEDGFITETSENQTLRYPLTKELHTVHYGEYLFIFFSARQAFTIPEKYLMEDKEAVIALLQETTTFETCEMI